MEQQDDQMPKDQQNQDNNDEQQKSNDSLAVEQSAEMTGEQNQGHRQSASLYESEDDDESTPRAEWAAPNVNPEEFE